jgi:tetratricopeptide (TPR) repeat protein
MWFGSREEQVKRLDARAHEALDAGAWDDAERAAAEMLDLGWSGGFEIKALAARGRGDDDAAVRALEEGVSHVPGSWLLWLLLGIVRSDLGRADDALAAFARALACEGCDGASVRFNRAIARHRSKDPGGALEDLEPILALTTPPPFAEDALGLAAACLAEVGRAHHGLALVQSACDACAESDPRRPRLLAELALALDRSQQSEGEVRAAFERAAEAGAATPAFLALGRRLAPVAAGAPRRFRLVVDVPARPGSSPAGAFRVFEIAAGDVASALELARVFLPAESRAQARVDQQHDLGDAAGELGVLWASGFAYYQEP